ncbi:hypothetical protein SDRG_13920 [Saprolegnia diclina VS20]|uniref:Histone-lysine N-methyltransferase n=1 Tax=Saprolegnia diclina (strain VS20) TaxID=1156394 RepID=T0R8H4_SAPDV|nr:hypothetical protein SDRG_13920 [Saprolegnia diclina VS20]EQC28373.1 hypothetical protein SDRG_13920 [Saprolegnia diclina VS20]|eukprot:XP_008618243.1 hypothetical protein SDRG_13920 [Saprolegnia diclina VS20]
MAPNQRQREAVEPAPVPATRPSPAKRARRYRIKQTSAAPLIATQSLLTVEPLASLMLPCLRQRDGVAPPASLPLRVASPPPAKRRALLPEAAPAVPVQWSPPKFGHLSKNVYLIKKAASVERHANKCACAAGATSKVGSSSRPIEAPRKKVKKASPAHASTYCGDACHNKMLYIECCDQTCSAPDPDLCMNRPFQHRHSKATRVQYMAAKGFGLVADEAMDAQDFILEYVGEVIDAAMVKERMAAASANRETHNYMLEIEKDIVIDARLKGNVSRFINHSCEPNARAQKWTCQGVVRIGIMALRPIAVDEEITFDYQFIHFGGRKVQCHCGAPGCKGVLGGNLPGSSGHSSSTPSDAELSHEAASQKLSRPQKSTSLSVFKNAQLHRDWLAKHGASNQRASPPLFLAHRVPDLVDVDSHHATILEHRRPLEAAREAAPATLALAQPLGKSFLAGGVLDYSDELRNVPARPAPCATRRPPSRVNLLDARSKLFDDIRRFARGTSRWNKRLNITQNDLDTDRVRRLLENVEDGMNLTRGDTADLNEDSCHRCGQTGELICCDGCPAAFHLSCAGLCIVPPSTWFCPPCRRQHVPHVSNRHRVQVAPSIFQQQPTTAPATGPHKRSRRKRKAP